MPSSTASRQRHIAHELPKSVLCRDDCSCCAPKVLAGLIRFHWLKNDEEESTSADEHSRVGYNFAALLYFFLFLDNFCGVRKDKVGAVSGHAPGDPMWWSCISC